MVEEKKEPFSYGSAAKAVPVGLASSLAGGATQLPLILGLKKHVESSPLTLEGEGERNIEKLITNMGLKKDTPVLIQEGTGIREALSSQYDPFDKEVRVSARTPIEMIAHEVGHATGLREKAPWLALPETIYRTLAVRGAPFYSGYVANKFLKDKSDNQSAMRGALKGGLIGAGTAGVVGLPMFAEEARASLRGLKGLKELGLSPTQLKIARRSLLATFATYLTTMAIQGVLGGSTVGAYHGFKNKRLAAEKKEKENNMLEKKSKSLADNGFNSNRFGNRLGNRLGHSPVAETAHKKFLFPSGRPALLGAGIGGILGGLGGLGNDTLGGAAVGAGAGAGAGLGLEGGLRAGNYLAQRIGKSLPNHPKVRAMAEILSLALGGVTGLEGGGAAGANIAARFVPSKATSLSGAAPKKEAPKQEKKSMVKLSRHKAGLIAAIFAKHGL